MFEPCHECGHEFPKHYRECYIDYCYKQAGKAAKYKDGKAMRRWLRKAGFHGS